MLCTHNILITVLCIASLLSLTELIYVSRLEGSRLFFKAFFQDILCIGIRYISSIGIQVFVIFPVLAFWATQYMISQKSVF